MPYPLFLRNDEFREEEEATRLALLKFAKVSKRVRGGRRFFARAADGQLVRELLNFRHAEIPKFRNSELLNFSNSELLKFRNSELLEF